ncbi:hypothetical protein [Microbacterium invictum]|uniref:Uncharacterized protein n=1 Tax=Microbacterium invictum TaxID=515415 RepID=A0AA40VKY7_9MICO|nr:MULTISPECIES: hypothetical protein [Microbacterium]MBB4138901.1 hypothetical protein [Microbacterium invictum]
MSSTVVREASATERAVIPPADRFMRRLLRVSSTDKRVVGSAHRAFRVAILVSAVRCLITYLAIPILIPIAAVAGLVAAPLSIALCLFAFVNGVISVRRFWIANHRYRWMYTNFMAVVFAVLAVTLVIDIGGLVAGA